VRFNPFRGIGEAYLNIGRRRRLQNLLEMQASLETQLRELGELPPEHGSPDYTPERYQIHLENRRPIEDDLETVRRAIAMLMADISGRKRPLGTEVPAVQRPRQGIH
jgi:hypothetical protein